MGIKLQGWNEKPFGEQLDMLYTECLKYILLSFPENLIAFVTGHCNDKLCLPCKLVLPSHDLTAISGTGLNQSLLTSGAGTSESDKCACMSIIVITVACDLVYVGGVDVAGPGSAALLSSAVQQFKALQLNTTNIVNFKATKDGIIITDIVNG